MQIFTLKALLHIIFVFLPTMNVYLVSTQPYTWRLTPITFWSWLKGVIVSLQGPKHFSGYLLDNRQFSSMKEANSNSMKKLIKYVRNNMKPFLSFQSLVWRINRLSLRKRHQPLNDVANGVRINITPSVSLVNSAAGLHNNRAEIRIKKLSGL